MILVGQYDSPFVRRVAVALKHYRFEFEHRPWSVWKDGDLLATLNPLRRVPVLVLDGVALVESAAILDSVDGLVPVSARLLPEAGAPRAAGLRVCALATGLADKCVALFYERLLHTEERRSATWVERCEEQINATLDLLEAERSARPGVFWFDRFSHADIALACALRFANEAHPTLLAAAARPALAAHAHACESMAVFAAVAQPLTL